MYWGRTSPGLVQGNLPALYKALAICRGKKWTFQKSSSSPFSPPDLESLHFILGDGVMHSYLGKPRLAQPHGTVHFPTAVQPLIWDVICEVGHKRYLCCVFRQVLVPMRCLQVQMHLCQSEAPSSMWCESVPQGQQEELSCPKFPVAWRLDWESHRKACFGTETCKANLLLSTELDFSGHEVGHSVRSSFPNARCLCLVVLSSEIYLLLLSYLIHYLTNLAANSGH